MSFVLKSENGQWMFKPEVQLDWDFTIYPSLDSIYVRRLTFCQNNDGGYGW